MHEVIHKLYYIYWPIQIDFGRPNAEIGQKMADGRQLFLALWERDWVEVGMGGEPKVGYTMHWKEKGAIVNSLKYRKDHSLLTRQKQKINYNDHAKVCALLRNQ